MSGASQNMKAESRVLNDDAEGDHYFTNTNLVGLNIRSSSQNAY